MSAPLAGQTAWITGSSRGLGRVMAEELVRLGANVAIHGSSYLELGPILGWFTASIGLHHVHHLNPRIPNHTLEKARREIPELQAVSPLGKKDLKRSFTHLFWDRDAMRMRSPEELDGALD